MHRGRILIVDDEPTCLAALRLVFEHLGFSVETSPNAADALSKLSSGQGVDVVMTDRLMPGMSGCELADRIKAQWPATPVVLIAGRLPLITPKSVDSVLQKPCSMEELECVVGALVPEPK